MSHYPPYSTTGTTYPYASYHPQTPGTYAYPQTSAAHPAAPYQPYAPPTAVTSYGAAWPYHGYSYYPQQQQAHTSTTAAPRPATTANTQTTTTPAPVTATPAVASSLPSRSTAPSTYTFTSYNRDPGLYTRSGRKGSSYRGLFTKERT
ncbi:hypothetical protein K466DRAFT_41649 [Polyporus arcularius HHB13444]|uniref:Uncharacterized protein n=1 Tax=Polyporus arcularius HHB13444 TaxID=1314778 RepID=A0A5C3PSN1_9APHY|nr:hypothetical protein K466DRAFT_41649 [Polyporus arcularius HHB13444]